MSQGSLEDSSASQQSEDSEEIKTTTRPSPRLLPAFRNHFFPGTHIRHSLSSASTTQQPSQSNRHRTNNFVIVSPSNSDSLNIQHKSLNVWEKIVTADLSTA